MLFNETHITEKGAKMVAKCIVQQCKEYFGLYLIPENMDNEERHPPEDSDEFIDPYEIE